MPLHEAVVWHSISCVLVSDVVETLGLLVVSLRNVSMEGLQPQQEVARGSPCNLPKTPIIERVRHMLAEYQLSSS